MKPRVLAPLAALLACLVMAAPASAALTGNWSGETTQDLSSFGLDEPYTTNIGFSVLNGRLVNLYAEVRMTCGATSIRDAKVLKSFKTGKGPKLTAKGAFSVSIEGVHIGGQLFAKRGEGNISAAKGSCSGKGTWTVSKRGDW